MSNTNKRNPEALLQAFAEMLNEFYGQGGQSALEKPEHGAQSGRQLLQQADLPLGPAETPLAAQPLERAAPWADVAGLRPKRVTMTMEPSLYKKMVWVTQNVPQMSLEKLARRGAEAEADRLIALYYNPESK